MASSNTPVDSFTDEDFHATSLSNSYDKEFPDLGVAEQLCIQGYDSQGKRLESLGLSRDSLTEDDLQPWEPKLEFARMGTRDQLIAYLRIRTELSPEQKLILERLKINTDKYGNKVDWKSFESSVTNPLHPTEQSVLAVVDKLIARGATVIVIDRKKLWFEIVEVGNLAIGSNAVFPSIEDLGKLTEVEYAKLFPHRYVAYDKQAEELIKANHSDVICNGNAFDLAESLTTGDRKFGGLISKELYEHCVQLGIDMDISTNSFVKTERDVREDTSEFEVGFCNIGSHKVVDKEDASQCDEGTGFYCAVKIFKS